MKRWSALLAGVFVAASCGGGGGGSSSPPPPTVPLPGITFTVAAPAAANSVAMTRNGGSSTTVLRIDVSGVDLTDLYGVAFDVLYPVHLFDLTSSTAGTFLDGELTSFQMDEIAAGHLVVGLTRLGAVLGVSGSGTVLALEFTSKGAAGTGTFSFDKSKAFDSNGIEIAGVTWLGGSATVIP